MFAFGNEFEYKQRTAIYLVWKLWHVYFEATTTLYVFALILQKPLFSITSIHSLYKDCGLYSFCLRPGWRLNIRQATRMGVLTFHNNDVIMSAMTHDCLLNCLFRRWSKKTSKLRVTGFCAGNSPVTGEFPAQMPATRKMFHFDDVIMQIAFRFGGRRGSGPAFRARATEQFKHEPRIGDPFN